MASLHDQEQLLQIGFEKDYMIQICNFIHNYEAVWWIEMDMHGDFITG